MADRSVHYEAAFEALLRARGIPYVAVDEAKRALFGDAPLKSFDFVVYSPRGSRLLVDIKGRQCRGQGGGRSFQTWATERDISDLAQWAGVFGREFQALLVFSYWVDSPLIEEPGLFAHGDRWYLLRGVPLDDYRNHMRRRSPRWGTVCLSAGDFRSLARPLEEWL